MPILTGLPVIRIPHRAAHPPPSRHDRRIVAERLRSRCVWQFFWEGHRASSGRQPLSAITTESKDRGRKAALTVCMAIFSAGQCASCAPTQPTAPPAARQLTDPPSRGGAGRARHPRKPARTPDAAAASRDTKHAIGVRYSGSVHLRRIGEPLSISFRQGSAPPVRHRPTALPAARQLTDQPSRGGAGRARHPRKPARSGGCRGGLTCRKRRDRCSVFRLRAPPPNRGTLQHLLSAGQCASRAPNPPTALPAARQFTDRPPRDSAGRARHPRKPARSGRFPRRPRVPQKTRSGVPTAGSSPLRREGCSPPQKKICHEQHHGGVLRLSTGCCGHRGCRVPGGWRTDVLRAESAPRAAPCLPRCRCACRLLRPLAMSPSSPRPHR
jgi:hypothetical protein